MEWFEIGEAIVAALDDGLSQREVARELGKSQPFVSKVARWWLESVGETRWWQKAEATRTRAERAGTHK
jgi:predicted XRE-type DNA-binding protein